MERRSKAHITAFQVSSRSIPEQWNGGFRSRSGAVPTNHAYDHFHIRAWVTVSQEYSINEIFAGLLQQMEGRFEFFRPFSKNELEQKKSKNELGEILYERLWGGRYLIVMDDVWSTQFWNGLKLFFPNSKNGSRIIVTTRSSNAVSYLASYEYVLRDFLDVRESWNLLCQKIFGDQNCPPELEKVGKEIAKGCKGLPLAIVKIGDLLANSNMKLEYWEFVAENMNSFVNSGDDDSFLKIWLSYNELPIDLKPCFLYMRIFLGDREIRVSKLIRTWVAEGFVTPQSGKTLEEVAYDYLNALVDRNLILSCQLTYNGKIKTCKITGVLRNLCLKEHEKEEFFRISKVQVANATEQSLCFLCSHQNASTRIYLPHQVLIASQTTSLGKCFVCDVCLTLYSLFDRLRLVRAICRVDGSYGAEFLQSTMLRYLDVGLGYQWVSISTSLHLLWNLQTLVISDAEDAIELPSEIWEMTQLRHVKISPMAILPGPPQESHQDSIVLENLQTLSCIKIFRYSKQILKTIPNVKKLGISSDRKEENWSLSLGWNLLHLWKLESLSLHCNGIILEEVRFPWSLRKLCLDGCNIPWGGMAIIGLLPNLEVLKLKSNSGGHLWNPIGGGFLRLQVLIMHYCDVVRWNAEMEHFPCLEILVLKEMHYLEEIPSDFWFKDTLQSIRLARCSQSLVKSAKSFLEEDFVYQYPYPELHVEDCDSE